MNIKTAEKLIGDYEAAAQQAAQRVAARETRRRALVKTLDAIIFDAAMQTDARRAFSARKKALGQTLPAALAESGLDDADAAIAALAADVADRGKIIAARAAAAAHLDTARAEMARNVKKLDQGGFTLLETRLAACIAAFAGAGTVGEYQAAGQLAQDFAATCGQALAHAAQFDAWNAKTTTFIANDIADEADRRTLRAWRRTLMADAAALVEQAKFAEAQARLEEFRTHVLVADGARVDEAGGFAAKLLDFQNSHMARFQSVIDAGVPDVNAHKNDYKTAAKIGLVDKLYGNAITAIDAVIAWYTPRLALAAKLNGLDAKLRKHKDFRDALAAMTADYTSGNLAAAATAFDGLDPAIAAEGDFHKRIKQLEPQYSAVSALLVDPEKAALKAEWDAAVKDADDGHKLNDAAARAAKFASATSHLDRAEAMLDLGALTGLYAGVLPILATHGTADGYGYLAGYRGDRAAGNYGAARTKLVAALALMQQLVAYLDLKKRAEAVWAAMPGAAPALAKRLDDALAAAEDQARAKSDPGAAVALLTTLLNETDFEAMASDIMDYQALLARAEALQKRVLKLMDLAKPQKALADSLDAARALADPGGDFPGGYAALQAHMLLLAKAQNYASVRRQTLGVIGALQRAVAQDPSREAAIFAGPKTLKDVTDGLATAEADAANAEFDDALAKYQSLLADCQAMTAACAQIYETADGAHSNAGHSLGRHGPGLTEPELIKRLKTGIAPDGMKSPTGASSKFKSMEDWLAGREMGAKLAMDKGVDVNMTKILPPFDITKEPLPAKFEIDHGKPIDEAYVGIKKAEVLDVNKGEIVEDKNYESFEKMTDLTKSLVNFTWEYDLIGGAPWPQDADGNDIKPKDNADYIAKYFAHHGVNPAEITGRYVMMQQYPVAEGWDDELKQYTS